MIRPSTAVAICSGKSRNRWVECYWWILLDVRGAGLVGVKRGCLIKALKRNMRRMETADWREGTEPFDT